MSPCTVTAGCPEPWSAPLPGTRSALRSSFERALTSTVDVGEDTDTVAAVTGGLARAVYGIEAVPARWTGRLPVPLPGYGDRRLRTADLIALAGRLDAEGLGTPADPPSAIPPISTHK